MFVAEIDLNNNSVRKIGLIDSVFPGIPNGIEVAYRYIDGNLYFIHDEIVYIYNEFLKTIKTTKPRNSLIFNLNCPTKPLLEQLQLLLSDIIFRKVHGGLR